MPLQATSGAASYDGFGGGVPFVPIYIEQIFATHLYTGNATNRTITNGIDLAGKGGMVWTKQRVLSQNHLLFDTARGVGNRLNSNTSNANEFSTTTLTSFNSDGFSLGTSADTNRNNEPYASWTFRKQPKFFDVVTYSGSSSLQNIQHNLGSVPGCIIIKKTNGAVSWIVYHRSLGAGKYIVLNSTGAEEIDNTIWNNTSPTSTQFTVQGNSAAVNESGGTYVAYLFAHDAGGFGLSGTDNVISCGSYTSSYPSKPSINLGWEPQFVLIKGATQSGAGSGPTNWVMFDNMRGVPTGGNDATLLANTSGAEFTNTPYIDFNATGFTVDPNGNGYNDVNYPANNTYIYIAIRRGPMKTPTSGTSVFSPNAVTSSSSNTTVDAGFPIDLSILKIRNAVDSSSWFDRLRGITASSNPALRSPSTAAEVSTTDLQNAGQTTVQVGPIGTYNDILWNFRRAPGFFDEVCYTGTGANRTVSHNLGVVPEMMIFKRRDTTANWRVYHSSQPASDLGILNSTSFFQTDTNVLNSTAPTASVFTVGTNAQTNASGGTYVAYLFATVAGVSKVGSYTGTGTTKQIDCGFTGGARFVLIKRVDDSGDWYVWDSARGIVAGNDPYLLLNSTAAEVTNTDYVDTLNAGFEISSTAPAAINANGGTFIFLAIA